MELIETPEYLKLDKKIPGIHNNLNSLQQYADLHLCTSRQMRQATLNQLETLNLLQFFKHVMVTEKKCDKELLIIEKITNLNHRDWLVGDTGNDIQVGKILNIKTCAVLSGFMSLENLRNYGPDLIIDSVVKFCLPIDI
jgi:phosphoglycolate phosphatase